MLYIIFYICILIAKEKGLEDVTEKCYFLARSMNLQIVFSVEIDAKQYICKIKNDYEDMCD